MLAVDTNILVYAHRTDTPWHEKALEVVTRLSESRGAWCIPWPCVHEFVSVATRNFWDPPSPIAVALETVEEWLRSPSLLLLSESATHWQRFRDLVVAARIVGPAIHDARIAAICLDHGVSELYSADRDLSRFPQLKTRNPLI